MRPGETDLTRREFVGVTVGAAGLSTSVADAAPPRTETEGVACSLTVNGQQHNLHLEPRVTLLDLLRERLHINGPKKGCDHGQCGACTVLVDGARVLSCLTLAITQDGRQITTIEGLGSPDHLHPMQAAFLEHDAFQCGFCTPGQICSAVALLQEPRPDPAAPLSDDEVRERMSGNICRCGAYPNIVAAVQDVAKHAREGEASVR
jgi:xanthine dehydrogenase YagT iron-sulfur-binding subunit